MKSHLSIDSLLLDLKEKIPAEEKNNDPLLLTKIYGLIKTIRTERKTNPNAWEAAVEDFSVALSVNELFYLNFYIMQTMSHFEPTEPLIRSTSDTFGARLYKKFLEKIHFNESNSESYYPELLEKLNNLIMNSIESTSPTVKDLRQASRTLSVFTLRSPKKHPFSINLEKIAAFNKIYKALRDGQTGFFKSNFVAKLDKQKLSPEKHIEAIQHHAKKENSRTAIAWALTEDHYDTLMIGKVDNNLVTAIHRECFRQSGYLFKKTQLAKGKTFIFFSSFSKYLATHAISPADITEACLSPNSRTGKIYQALV